MNEEIIKLCLNNNIDVLDIKSIQTIALKTKRYDMLVYINNNSIKYISYAKEIKQRGRLNHNQQHKYTSF